VQRSVEVLPSSAEESGFAHVRSVVRTRTRVWEVGEGGKKKNQREETREWISSLEAEETGARRFGELVRGHWDIENGSHRQRDMIWGEDRQRMKSHKRAHILAMLRQVALCLTLKHQQKRGETKRKKQAMSQQVQSLQRNLDRGVALITGKYRE
jgi:predicted transposase YbfD/YdcC